MAYIEIIDQKTKGDIFEILVKSGRDYYSITNYTKDGKIHKLNLKHRYKDLDEFYDVNRLFEKWYK